jgi:nitroreductase
VDLDNAIRTRRTFKDFGTEPVPRDVIMELVDLARFAPNHHLTQPWRFRVIGPETRERLRALAGPGDGPKLDRAPTLILATCRLTGDPLQDDEDLHATACAVYAILLAAHGRGLAGYWRTPAVLRTPAGRATVGLQHGERVVSLIHLGPPGAPRPAKDRLAPEAFVSFLP